MWCDNYIFHFPERAALLERFFFKNIQTCSGNLALFKGTDQILFDQDFTSANID
ncbi:Uncharacterised protein [Mycobacteroides abscessus subsp. abscessus]|nr:Uncharacterised protein [Mycobacteroides abscessus subsp. abscessus]